MGVGGAAIAVAAKRPAARAAVARIMMFNRDKTKF
jgi:shikimate 5-dehydrogenase